MSTINYSQFREIISKYSDFNKNTLLALYKEFGKDTINDFFEKYCQTLKEDEFVIFINKFQAYFERKEQDEIIEEEKNKKLEDKKKFYEEKEANEDKIVNDIVATLIDTAKDFQLMTFEEEKEHGQNLKEGRNNLIITKKIDKNALTLTKEEKEETLYPNLELEKILLSIRDKEDIDLLKTIKKLPYSLKDETILKKDIDIIRKYLKMCEIGIPNIRILKQTFPNLCFDNVKPLTKDEFSVQLNLLRKYIIARYNFYNRNLRLVISVAKKYIHKNFSFEDAIQEGNIGLIKAINRFEVDKGFKFSTYATCWIKQNIIREMANTGDVIRIPVHMIEKIRKYDKFCSDYISDNGIEPTISECAVALDLTEKEIIKLKTISLDVLSLETPVNPEDEAETFHRFIISDEELIEDKVVKKAFFDNILDVMSACLTEREIQIVFERNGYNEKRKDLTLEAVGEMFGVTRERIRQIEAKAYKKIRRKMGVN